MESPEFSRRQFLRLSAAFAATGVVTACVGPSSPTATSRGGVVGTSASSAPTGAANPTAAAHLAPTLAVAQANATPVEQQAGPTTYAEAPMLAAMTKAGRLPSVEQRLPQNPRVLKPLDAVGQYGGTWHRMYKGLSDRVGPTKLLEQPLIHWDAPDPNTIRLIANIIEKWETNADTSEYTFYLRKGIRWSDGTEVTTDDTKFWWDDIQLNKDIRPTPTYAMRQRVGNDYKIASLTVVDQYTFRVKYAQPYPLLPILIAKLNGESIGQVAFLAPSAYLKRFHSRYASQDALKRAAADRKVATWQDLWGNGGDMEGPIAFWFLNPDLPVITPWKIAIPAPADPVVMERNPYFWQVDTEGHQLPYIDRIEHLLFDSVDVLNLHVAGGQIDMQLRHMTAGSYTFYKENENRGNYKVFQWRAANTDAYFPNITCQDKVLAKLFDTAEFRQALSIAINRSAINQLVWNGLGKPRQASPIMGSPEYDAELEKVWAEYDPTRANDLLDKLGLVRQLDGTRQRPDGKVLEVIIEHTDTAASPGDDAHQRVKKYWDAIGVKTNVKFVERSLYEEHLHANQMQIGQWALDRCSVAKADPVWWIGKAEWAIAYGNWYDQNAYAKEEPPEDHPIREIWTLWDRTQVEPDEIKRNALFQQLLAIHKQHPYAIGVVGEKVQPVIVSNKFKNFRDGYIYDDTLRDTGLLNPQQFFLIQ